MIYLLGVFVFFAVAACGGGGDTREVEFDRQAALGLVKTLSDDALEGRGMGTQGSRAAQDVIEGRMREIGLKPAGAEGYRTPFARVDMTDAPGDGAPNGVNLIARVDGTGPDGQFLVITAHYDHLGVVDGEIYNGADDNASGVSAMLAIAEAFVADPPIHDTLFVAFDGEEQGFQGAVAFMTNPPVPVKQMAFNLNLDMVSKSDSGELYAVGTYHHPELVPVVDAVAADAPVRLLMGHDRPEDGDQDWTLLSDHRVFHLRGIPFLYLGVEDHPEYHKPSDDFVTVPEDFFLDAIETSILVARAADAWVVEQD